MKKVLLLSGFRRLCLCFNCIEQAYKMINEGSVINVPPEGGRKHPEKPMISIDTQNILFIAGGAFNGLENIIKKRLNKRFSSIGYKNCQPQCSHITDLLQYTTPEDLRYFGLIPELIGRLPIITYMNSLDVNALFRIMIEPKNALIKQYQKLFSMDGVHLKVTDKAIRKIVEKTLTAGLGARGLRNMCERIFNDFLFHIENLPSILEIDENIVDNKFKKYFKK